MLTDVGASSSIRRTADECEERTIAAQTTRWYVCLQDQTRTEGLSPVGLHEKCEHQRCKPLREIQQVRSTRERRKRQRLVCASVAVHPPTPSCKFGSRRQLSPKHMDLAALRGSWCGCGQIPRLLFVGVGVGVGVACWAHNKQALPLQQPVFLDLGMQLQ